jgi:hypothetical protein
MLYSLALLLALLSHGPVGPELPFRAKVVPSMASNPQQCPSAHCEGRDGAQAVLLIVSAQKKCLVSADAAAISEESTSLALRWRHAAPPCLESAATLQSQAVRWQI